MNIRNAGMDNRKATNTANRLTTALLAIYLGAICWILLFKMGVRFSYMETRRVNLIPFYEPLVLKGKFDLVGTILNVLVFVPLGIYAGALFGRWRLQQHLLLLLSVSLLVESLQFILAIGAFDVTDVITNATGGLIGLLLFKAIAKACNSNSKAQKIINVFAAIGTALAILLLLLLKLNMLPIRYQ